LKAEALYLADRTSEALEAISEAEGLVERFEVRWWSAELHRLRGVFLTAMGAKETEIEASFPGGDQHRKAAEVKFAIGARGDNIRRIPSPKSERIRRAGNTVTSLVAHPVGAPENFSIGR
jgi:hypothetical protein